MYLIGLDCIIFKVTMKNFKVFMKQSHDWSDNYKISAVVVVTINAHDRV